MNKTIEELAKQYAEYMWPAEDYSDSDCDDGRDTDIAISIDDARSVLGWFFNRPLAQRLTDAEEEMVRTKYNAAKIAATECDSPECAEFMDMLEDLFGKEFFKEDKL